ncbi:LysR family transcriptional regulator [Alicycliphilus sp. B1]|nr:LysR family transcriptional regulator [Pseudomonadota bacterium]GAO21479.1 LysR family transcriptional regulator [Alicycliphilus sp. B1]
MTEFDANRMDELSALVAVAKMGSFVAAGRALERHATIVSKRIASLEHRLGVRLIERTTRQVRLTDAGQQLAGRLGVAANLILDAEKEASVGAVVLRGNLRIALPAAMGRLWLAPLLPFFMQRYPELHVEVNYSERYVDLVAEGYDAALRVGTLKDSRLLAQRLGQHQRILCTSPAYIERNGVPEQPSQLAEHNCLEFEGFASFPNWRLSDGSRCETVTARGSMRSNDNAALLEAARAGVGILGAGEWLVTRDIADGRLVRVLPDWAFDVDGGIFLVRPSAQHVPARTDAFLEWMREQFRQHMPWCQE